MPSLLSMSLVRGRLTGAAICDYKLVMLRYKMKLAAKLINRSTAKSLQRHD